MGAFSIVSGSILAGQAKVGETTQLYNDNKGRAGPFAEE
jgi:hypothetical protein